MNFYSQAAMERAMAKKITWLQAAETVADWHAPESASGKDGGSVLDRSRRHMSRPLGTEVPGRRSGQSARKVRPLLQRPGISAVVFR